MRYVVWCEECETQTVSPVDDAGTVFQRWRCWMCGEVKHWCPRCDQGWLRHMRIPALSVQRYVCDECDASWPAEQLARHSLHPFTDFSVFLEAAGLPRQADCEVLRDIL